MASFCSSISSSGSSSRRNGSLLLMRCMGRRYYQQQQYRWMGHTVRIICTEDLPNGKAYKGDVTHVKAGYARNYLIPQKMAIYATYTNFQKLGIPDPDVVVKTTKQQSQDDKDKDDETSQDFKAADLLRYYLRNKVLKIWRNIDAQTYSIFPGMVDANAIRSKLSKQLKIDLERHETVHILQNGTPVPSHAELTEEQIETMMKQHDDEIEQEETTTTTTTTSNNTMSHSIPSCTVEIRKLGSYLAKITLKGGYTIPLKFVVLKR